MTRPGRPRAVVAFLHRPRWWSAGCLVFAALYAIGTWRAATYENERFERVTTVSATVTDRDQEHAILDVAYETPSGRVVDAIEVQDDRELPAAQSTVQLQVSLDVAGAARLADDVADDAALESLLLSGGGAVVAIAFAVTRTIHVRRLERLMASPEVSFAMLGAIVPPSGWGRRWRLALYPLDSGPCDRPVCELGLVAAPVLPEGAFPVEVKGRPRAGGRVAVRTDEGALWPRGRALVGARIPRPEMIRALLRSGASADSRARALPKSPWPWRGLRVVGLVLLAVAVVGFNEDGMASRDRYERSRAAEATVVRVDDSRQRALGTVEFPLGDGRHSATIEFDAVAPPPGAPIAVRYDVTDPDVVWERADWPPLSPAANVAGLALFGGIAANVVGTRLRSRWQADRAQDELCRLGRVVSGFPPYESRSPLERILRRAGRRWGMPALSRRRR